MTDRALRQRTQTTRSAVIARILGPVCYAALAPVVLVLTVIVLSWSERAIGFHRVWLTGDIDMLVIATAFGVLLFLPASRFLAWIEQLRSPTGIDFIRQSGLLIAASAALTWRVVDAWPPTGAIGWAWLFGLLLACLLGVIINGAWLAYLRLKR